MLSPPWSGLTDLDPAVFDDLMELNLRSTFLTTTAARPPAASPSDAAGSIVALSPPSPACARCRSARRTRPAKAALMSLVRTAALEWGPLGIRINAVAPGHRAHPEKPAEQSRTRRPTPRPRRAAVPLGRRGHGDDIAGAVAFLLSDLAGWITGQVLSVDGGATARPSFRRRGQPSGLRARRRACVRGSLDGMA